MKDLSQYELQEAYLLHGHNFDKFLDVSRSEMYKIIKENNLLHPTDYVKNILKHSEGCKIIISLLRDLGTWQKVAERFSVSESFLRSLIDPLYDNEIPHDVDKFKSEITRLGSVSLYARANNLKESSVRKFAEGNGVELSGLISYEDTGHQNGKGRKAELFFAGVRGDRIIEDKNKEDNQFPYDFEDALLGRVDVKSSKRYSYKSKTRSSYKHYWKFSVGNLTCDNVAFIAYDEKYENVVFWFVMPTVSMDLLGGTITVNGLVQTIIDSKGEVPIISKYDFDRCIVFNNLKDLIPVDRLRHKS